MNSDLTTVDQSQKAYSWLSCNLPSVHLNSICRLKELLGSYKVLFEDFNMHRRLKSCVLKSFLTTKETPGQMQCLELKTIPPGLILEPAPAQNLTLLGITRTSLKSPKSTFQQTTKETNHLPLNYLFGQKESSK